MIGLRYPNHISLHTRVEAKTSKLRASVKFAANENEVAEIRASTLEQKKPASCLTTLATAIIKPFQSAVKTLKTSALKSGRYLGTKLGWHSLHLNCHLALNPGYQAELARIKQHCTIVAPGAGIELLPAFVSQKENPRFKMEYPKGKIFVDGIPFGDGGDPDSVDEFTGMNLWVDTQEMKKKLKELGITEELEEYIPFLNTTNFYPNLDEKMQRNLFYSATLLLAPYEAAQAMFQLKENWLEDGLLETVSKDQRPKTEYESYIDIPCNHQRMRLMWRLVEKIKQDPECFEVPKNLFETWGSAYGTMMEKMYGKDTLAVYSAALKAAREDKNLLISLGYIPCDPCFSELGVKSTRGKIEELVAEGVIPLRKPVYEAILKEHEPDYKPTTESENK